jgi:hypothetical protein
MTAPLYKNLSYFPFLGFHREAFFFPHAGVGEARPSACTPAFAKCDYASERKHPKVYTTKGNKLSMKLLCIDGFNANVNFINRAFSSFQATGSVSGFSSSSVALVFCQK